MNIKLFTFLLLLSFTISVTQAQKLSPSEREEFLLEIEKLEEAVNEKRIGNRKAAVAAFTQASSSDKTAFDFFLECNKLLNFEYKSHAEYRTWRERAENRNKNKGSMLAFQIQLSHLILSLRYAEGVELEDLMPEIEALVDQVVKNFEELEKSGMNITRENAKQSVFSKVYSLDQSMNLEDWCFQPGDYNAMYNLSLIHI